jgi:hypothetical protein
MVASSCLTCHLKRWKKKEEKEHTQTFVSHKGLTRHAQLAVASRRRGQPPMLTDSHRCPPLQVTLRTRPFGQGPLTFLLLLFSALRSAAAVGIWLYLPDRTQSEKRLFETPPHPGLYFGFMLKAFAGVGVIALCAAAVALTVSDGN